IVAGSSNPKFFRSKGGDCDADEFAFHREPRELYKAMQPAALVWGHQMRLWSTHNGEGSFFNQLVRTARNTRGGVVEWRGGGVGREARAFDPTTPPHNHPTTATYYAGFDVGRKHDRSVLWLVERVGDVLWTRGLRVLRDVNFTAQEQLLIALMQGRSVRRLCVDSTGIGAMLAERLVQRFGHRVEAIHFTAAVKSDLAMPLLRLFQDRLVRIPSDPLVREDLHKVRKIVTASNHVRLEADRDDRTGHADRFWALALACHAAEEEQKRLPAPLARKPVGW